MNMNKNNYIETEYNKPFIRQRADPYVYRHSDGSYYFTASVPEYDRIVLRRSNTLNGLRESDEVTIWKKHDKGIMSVHIWAPEIHYLDNKWFIYYAGGDIDDIWAIRPYVLVCEGQNPLNDPWKELGMVKATDAFSFNDFSLDMTVFENKGKRYCVWAEKVNIGKKISNLYIAEMKSPTELATAQVLLSSPDYEWERVGFWVNEGPAVIKHNGKIFLTYSASETGECYCMGMLSIGENEEILNPRAWKKECNPVLKTDVDKQIYGPGHNSFVKDETGKPINGTYHYSGSVKPEFEKEAEKPADGTLTFVDGRAEISLLHGQQITLQSLPLNAAYVVTENEANKDRYITTYNGKKDHAEGVLSKDTAVDVINNRQPDQAPSQGKDEENPCPAYKKSDSWCTCRCFDDCGVTEQQCNNGYDDRLCQRRTDVAATGDLHYSRCQYRYDHDGADYCI